jgi:ferredoxin
MDVKQTLQQQMQALHGTLEAAIRDCPADALTRKLPGSTINSIGAIYAHTIFSEDGILNALIRGGTPVYFAGGWAPKVGSTCRSMEPDWTVTLDISLCRQYAAAVYEATDEYLATVSDAELDRIVDPGFAPPMPVRSFVANLLAWHVATHQGEISALKGVQGFNGLDLTH